MFNEISDFTLALWRQGRKVKNTHSGWITGSGPCCIHNNETQDTRGRAGFKIDNQGGISYHCFNCNFKTGFKPGRRLPIKFRNLLRWLGASEGEVHKLIIDALRMQELIGLLPIEKKKPYTKVIKEHALPAEAMTLDAWATFYAMSPNKIPVNLVGAIMYATSRGLDMGKHDFYWTPNNGKCGMASRLIIPFYWHKQIIGYTARTFSTKKNNSKYINGYEEGGYVYNTENLIEDSDFVLVQEGPIDALLIDGVAVLTNTISDEQIEIIEGLGKQIIMVPDQNEAGYRMIDIAIRLNWDVAFPEWERDVEDTAQAIDRYGKTFTLKSILSDVATTGLKIELLRKCQNI